MSYSRTHELYYIYYKLQLLSLPRSYFVAGYLSLAAATRSVALFSCFILEASRYAMRLAPFSHNLACGRPHPSVAWQSAKAAFLATTRALWTLAGFVPPTCDMPNCRLCAEGAYFFCAHDHFFCAHNHFFPRDSYQNWTDLPTILPICLQILRKNL